MPHVESYRQQAEQARIRAEHSTSETEKVAALQDERDWTALVRRAEQAAPHEQAALREAAERLLSSKDATAALKLSASIIADAAQAHIAMDAPNPAASPE